VSSVSFVEGRRDGRPWADLVELAPGRTVDEAVAELLAERAGWAISADETLGRALIAAGAQPLRHAHVQSRDLVADPPPPTWSEPPGVRLTGVDRPAAALVAAYDAAYRPGHPDYDRYGASGLTRLLAGEHGLELESSGLAVDDTGAVVGACLIGGTDLPPPFGGPWVLELFRDPRYPGVGRALLERSLARLAAAGRASLGLAVTDGNPARELYRRLGLADVSTSLTVVIPGPSGER
jgi:ribosomal protein S18 acetylase RimI-like enzyme